jgi:hypothetical protein
MIKNILAATGVILLALMAVLASPALGHPVDQLAPLPPPYAAFLPTVPGAINPLVNQGNIASTICVSGWTKTVRPPTSYTNKIKRTLMLTLHLPGKAADYELDHEMSIEDGGDPSSLANLWMQTYAGPYGARTKDKLETLLKRLVCNGTIPLAEAQHELMFDWIEAYTARIGPLP